jgi:hypothetical protein
VNGAAKLLVIIAVAMSCIGAKAPKKFIGIYFEWNLETIPDQAEAHSLSNQSRTMNVAKLYPDFAYSLQNDLIGKRGAVVFAAGDRLVGLNRPNPTGCDFYTGDKIRCLVDSDGDGAFDQMFKLRTFTGPLLRYSGHARPEQIAPVRYLGATVSSAAEVDRYPLFLQLRLRNRIQASSMGIFSIGVSSPAGALQFSPDQIVYDKKLPFRFNAFGYGIIVRSVSRSGTYQIEIRPPKDPGKVKFSDLKL